MKRSGGDFCRGVRAFAACSSGNGSRERAVRPDRDPFAGRSPVGRGWSRAGLVATPCGALSAPRSSAMGSLACTWRGCACAFWPADRGVAPARVPVREGTLSGPLRSASWVGLDAARYICSRRDRLGGCRNSHLSSPSVQSVRRSSQKMKETEKRNARSAAELLSSKIRLDAMRCAITLCCVVWSRKNVCTGRF